MLNIITRDTKKTDVLNAYRDYQDTQPNGFEPLHKSRVEPILCEIPDGSKVLDVGCNSGEFLKLLKAKNCEAVGVDVADTLIEVAKAKGLNVLYADAEHLPFDDASFDVVVCMEVLIHLHDPVKALKEIRRVLKPSGFLLGSAPHANLESVVWEEKKPHHKYYDEKRISDDLGAAFEETHLKVLNGAQFSVEFASSMMADQPAEILFKCGGKGTNGWEHALLSDTKTLRVWMGCTQPPADAYYRMIGYANKMRAMKDTEVGYEDFDWKDNGGPGSWQTRVIRNENGEPVSSLAVHHLESLLKVANPWVFQVSYFDDVVGLMGCAKEVMPRKKLVTEIDDYLFDIPSYNVASHPYRPNSPQEQAAYEQLEISDALIVSTGFLKEKFEEMFPGKKVYVVPNSIDFDLWDNAKPDGQFQKKKEGVVRIGYTGCANHDGDMAIVKPVLLALLNEFPNLEVIIAQDFGCFKDEKHERLHILNRWAAFPEYPSMVKGWDLDIGIAPLRDNNFNRAKSNLRWLEYSALRIPTVASRVRPFSESISDDFTGFLCSSKQEWYDRLKTLIEDKGKRLALGQASNDIVRTRFNMDRVAEKYRKILEEIRKS